MSDTKDIDGRLHCRFEFGGKTYDYHGEGSHFEYKQVKTFAGLSMLQLPYAVQTGDVDGLLAMVWLAKQAAGEKLTWLELADQLTDPQALLATVEPIDPVIKPKAAPAPTSPEIVVPLASVEPEPAAVP